MRTLCACGCGQPLRPASSYKDHRAPALKAFLARRRFLKGHNYQPPTRHGHARDGHVSPTYRSWLAMHSRCENPRWSDYANYGGRGITVCDRWKRFENFLADMGPRPEGKTLDRIDGDGGYRPGNCRWATPKEQRANQREREKA